MNATITALFLIIVILIVRMASYTKIGLFKWFFLPKQRRRHLGAQLDRLQTLLGAPGTAFSVDHARKRAINQRHDLEYHLRELMLDILSHMGLPEAGDVQLFIVHSQFDSFSGKGGGRAGTFQRTNCYNKEIELFLRKDYTFWQIASVLCHECAHYYMEAGNLPQGADNEELTDILTIFMGFGQLMQRGYATRARTVTQGNMQGTAKSWIGYIKEGDIAWLRRSVKKRGPVVRAVDRGAYLADKERQADERRRRQELQEQKQLLLQAEHAALLQRLSVAQQLFEGFQLLAQSARTGTASETPDDLHTLQKIYLSIEQDEVGTEIRAARNAVDGLDDPLQSPEHAARIDAICAQLTAWNTLLSRIV